MKIGWKVFGLSVVMLSGCLDYFGVNSHFVLDIGAEQAPAIALHFRRAVESSGGYCNESDELAQIGTILECRIVGGTIGFANFVHSENGYEVVYETDYHDGFFAPRVPYDHRAGFMFVNDTLKGVPVKSRFVVIVNAQAVIPVDESMYPLSPTPWLPVQP